MSMKMLSYESIFGLGEEPENGGTPGKEQVVLLPIDQIRDKQGHSFTVRDDVQMAELVESIRRVGVLEPCLVHRLPDGGYEINSGHRRKRASLLAGKTHLPAIIRECSPAARDIEEVDSNLYRGELSPMEKARAYRKRMDAIREEKKSGQETGDVSRKPGTRSDEILAAEMEESRNQINRYLRLNELIDPLQELADEKKLPLVTAVELSYLTAPDQELVVCCMGDTIPSAVQAKALREYGGRGQLNRAVVELVLQEKEKPARVTLKRDVLSRFFPPDCPPDEMQRVIYDLLAGWKAGDISISGK